MLHALQGMHDQGNTFSFATVERIQSWAYTWLPIGLVIGLGVWGGLNIWPALEPVVRKFPAAMAVFVGTLTLSSMPLLICVVQTTTKKRQLSKLMSVSGHPLAYTGYFQAGRKLIESSRAAGDILDYLAPFLSLVMVLILGFGAIFFAYYDTIYFGAPNPILGGMKLPPHTWNWQTPDLDLADYQRGTFGIMAAAFIGSYIYTLGRLVERVNTNDLYPVSLYYYAGRTIIAIFTTAVLRHVAHTLGIPQDTSMLILLGFATGLAPDNMVLTMARRGFQQLKTWYSRSEPEDTHRPTSFPLMMIDDLTREKVDRFNELGIDSAQMLACQNPFLLWTRCPFDLGLLIDWIAQAQLYALVRDEGMENLRRLCINDVFDFYIRLSCPQQSIAACRAIGVDPECSAILIKQLQDDQSFSRLLEVRDAILHRPDDKPAVAKRTDRR